MSLWDKMTSYISEKIEDRKLTKEQFIEELTKAKSDLNQTFDSEDIIDPEDLNNIKSNYSVLYQNAISEKNSIFNLFNSELKRNTKVFIDEYDNIQENFDKHNNEIANKKKAQYFSIINPVEGRDLDGQQLSAIVKDSHNHLILAGAGTGKTTTIIGYIKYLLALDKAKPEDILVLSFTNASAAEMSERLQKETKLKIDASTFHKLGMNIIAEAENRKPTVYSENINKYIKQVLDELVKDKNYFRKLCSYLIFYSEEDKSEFEFEDEGDYREYLKQNPPTTLKGERVKSYGEMTIANFLLTNAIEYEYESAYKFDTADKKHSQYKPDFYLPEYDIYIEYFGIDRNGEAPKWFKGDGNQSGTEMYKESMSWKRKLHKDNKTNLVELFAYEHFENRLLDSLSEQLKKYDVKFKPLSGEEMWKNVGGEKLNVMVDLFATIINLMKSNNCDFDELERRNSTLARPIRLNIIVDLLKPIYEAYQKHLIDIKQIDFNDMINVAIDHIENNRYQHNYKYVIVDEYQDIAQSRFRLLEAMRNQKNYNLFCVGDDWQSIYKFSGSDIGFILAFDKYWGPTLIDRIETTYRFHQSLIEVSGNFIMQNNSQIKKSLKSKQNVNFFSCEEIQGYNEKFAIQFVESSLNNLEKNASVLFLGRYTFDINMLKGNYNFDYKYDNVQGKIVVKYKKRYDLDITFMTAHGSKGLQADYVYILNNKNRGLGFPSRISDAPILKLLLDSSDNYPFAEERRLFYVALTRAKKKVYLVTEKNNESIFVQEIKDIYGQAMQREKYTCPECGGKLLRRHGKYGDFFGCSNYKNGCKYIRKIT
ncbi:MAG: UvrD-helicase domain-containing protein [Erysipelotrichaceae bacterium]|nr:UvrD-helicase domain-containing protein [Erysipelotrichaceae bacterium]